MKGKIIAFIMLSIMTFSLASGCVKNDTGNLVIDGKEVVLKVNDQYITADELFEGMLSYSSNMEYVYQKIKEVVVKTVAPVNQTMQNTVNAEIDAWEAGVRADSIANSTSYADAKEAALGLEGVESTNELIEKKLFALQLEKAKSDYWKQKEDYFYNLYLSENMPFHISQILVSISETSTLDMVQKTISTTEAEELANISSRLLAGEKFYNVASLSDDSETSNNGGDLGLIGLTSDVPNEVKYALLSYAMFVENAEFEFEVSNFLSSFYGNGIEAIPSQYIDQLEEYANDYTYRVSNNEYSSSRMYARSIIFNNLFNSKTFKYLVDNSENASKNDNAVLLNNVKMPNSTIQGFASASSNYVIVNSSEYPLLVVRSSQGIHFVSINMSPFSDNSEKYFDLTPDFNDDYLSFIELGKTKEEQDERKNQLSNYAKEYANLGIYGNADESYIDYRMIDEYMESLDISIVDQNLRSKFDLHLSGKIAYFKNISIASVEGDLNKISNYVELVKSNVMQKELVPLICITQKENCTQTYENGFVYTAPGGGQ